MTTDTETTTTDRRSVLLQHLSGVYTLARALTPDEDRAAALVRETYAQAFILAPTTLSPEEARLRLTEWMVQIHFDRQAFAASEEPDAPVGARLLQPMHRHLVDRVVDRILPVVFATRPPEERLVLLLCDAEGMTVADAARVLGLGEREVRERLEEARAACEHNVRAEATPQEQAVLPAEMPEGWLAEGLRRLAEDSFGTVPLSLRESVTRALTSGPETLPADPPPLPAEASAESTPVPPQAPATETTSASVPKRRRSTGRRVALTVLLLATLGLVGYSIMRFTQRPPESNLLTLAALQAEDVEPAFETDNPQQAEEFVLERLDWRLTLPSIDSATLTGVGIHELVDGVAVPVFLYEDTFANGAVPLTLFVFNYALLDRYQDRVRFNPDVLRQIQNEQRFDLYDLGERSQVLIWRHRDDIFLAVTPGDAELLRQRIVIPS